jgi:two-component system, sensor histidine kinase and response regulator
MNHDSKVRLLYIEDDPLLADLFTTVMEAEGYSVETALTGQDGLDRHFTNPFDIVAIDYALPDIKGLVVAEKMLAHDSDLAITFLTGSGSESVAAKAIELGVMNYIIKGDKSVYLELLPPVIENLNNARLERIEKRAGDAEIKRTTEYLEAIIANTAEGIITIDDKGLIETFNPAVEKMFGYSPRDVIGQNVSMLMPFQDRAYHEELTRHSAINAPRIINRARELSGLHKDGALFPMELNIAPMKAGSSRKFVGIVRNISDRQNAARSLQESEEKNRLILQSAGEGIYGLDLKGRTTFVNPAACALLGYEEAELIGEPMHPLIHHSHSDGTPFPRHECFVHATLIEGEIHHVTNEVLWCKDGTNVPVEYTSTPIRKDDSIVGAVITFKDITERQRDESKIRQAREVADHANQAKSEFLSSMSHEIRTPMNAILGFGQMLQYNSDEPLTETQKDCVNHIMKGGQHLLDLTNEILDLAKIEAGKVDLSLEEIPPMDVCEECLALVQTLADERGIKILRPDSKVEIPEVLADYTRLKQVFLNLISNAIKYNNENGTITVGFYNKSDGLLRFSVSDTGDGIPEDRQGELFQPFSRLGAENTEIEGTGIGLTVSKQLIELMGGQIGFANNPAQGSTFWFDLPFTKTALVG